MIINKLNTIDIKPLQIASLDLINDIYKKAIEIDMIIDYRCINCGKKYSSWQISAFCLDCQDENKTNNLN